MAAASRSLLKLGGLEPARTAFFICDVQEVFRPHVKYFPQVVSVSNKLIDGAKHLKIPVYISEQYPKGLGHTAKDVNAKDATLVYHKTSFSMLNQELRDQMKKDVPNLASVVIVGMETHVCVEQTVMSLLAEDIFVHLCADGVSSRSKMDRELAIERMRSIGAFITTSENVLFKLIKGKDHPAFKEVQRIIKIKTPDSYDDLPQSKL